MENSPSVFWVLIETTTPPIGVPTPSDTWPYTMQSSLYAAGSSVILNQYEVKLTNGSLVSFPTMLYPGISIRIAPPPFGLAMTSTSK